MYLTVIKSSLYKCQDLIYHPLQHKYKNILEAALADKKKLKNPPFFPPQMSPEKKDPLQRQIPSLPPLISFGVKHHRLVNKRVPVCRACLLR